MSCVVEKKATPDPEDDACNGRRITKAGRENCRKVLFADKSHFSVKGGQRSQYVWRSNDEKLCPCHINRFLFAFFSYRPISIIGLFKDGIEIGEYFTVFYSYCYPHSRRHGEFKPLYRRGRQKRDS